MNNRRYIKKLQQGFIALAGMATIGLAYTNCSAVNFKASGALEAATDVKMNSVCVDSTNAIHQSGDTWTQVVNLNQTVAGCTDPNAQESDKYLCSNGQVSLVSSNVTASTPTCQHAVLDVVANPANIYPGTLISLGVEADNVMNPQYVCHNAWTGAAVSLADANNNSVPSSGNLVSGPSNVPLGAIAEDLRCAVSATDDFTNQPLNKSVDFIMDCESKGLVKNYATGRCEEFTCKSFQTLTQVPGQVLHIPKRTTDGICYAVKLLNAIPVAIDSDANDNGTPKNNTTDVDLETVSYQHARCSKPQLDANGQQMYDANGNALYVSCNSFGDPRTNVQATYGESRPAANPFNIGSKKLNFIMDSGLGARQVKVSGSDHATVGFEVDNFLMVGFMPADQQSNPSNSSYYRVFGGGGIGFRSDSTPANVPDYVYFRGSKIYDDPSDFDPNNGTFSVKALDITGQVKEDSEFFLDIRALDCGFVRRLSSDVYIIFQ